MEIEWTDTDPETGGRRYVCAEKFARVWKFKVRHHRRTPWERTDRVTRDMLETLLDAMVRRYQRREGVSDEDLAAMRKRLAGHVDPPALTADDLRADDPGPGA